MSDQPYPQSLENDKLIPVRSKSVHFVAGTEINSGIVCARQFVELLEQRATFSSLWYVTQEVGPLCL